MTTEQEKQKTIAFVLYPGLTVFDLTGPLQVLTALSAIAPEYRTVISWVNAWSPRTPTSPER